jgi:CBS domain-containing protein
MVVCFWRSPQLMKRRPEGENNMQVKDIMTHTLKTVSASTSLIEVVSMMCLYRYSGIPVLEDDKLIGIISEKDILHSLLPSLDDLMRNRSSIDFDALMKDYGTVVQGTVADLMTNKVMTVSPDMHILKAASVMAGNRFRRIPVAVGDKLVGMLSLGDVHKAIFHSCITSSLSATQT